MVALDSAEPLLIERWIRQGHLPTLGRLAGVGLRRPIATLRGFGNGVFWPSLATCVGPGEHGRYYFNQIVPGTYRIEPFNSKTNFQAKPFWWDIDHRGGKVATVDFVRTPIADLKNGVEIFDWLPHDREGPACSNPPGLIDELHGKYGKDPLSDGVDKFISKNWDYAELMARLSTRIEWKADYCVSLLEQGDWDLFVATFADFHDVGHLCWHLHDEEDARHDPAFRRGHGDPMLVVYKLIDAALERLLHAAGPSTTIVLVAGPGFEANRSGNHLLGELLHRIEFGAPDADDSKVDVPVAAGRLRRACKKYMPIFIWNLLHPLWRRREERKSELDRSNRLAFVVPHNDNAGAIRINLKGREPNGKISPGESLESKIEELRNLLFEIKDIDSGLPLVSEIIRTSDVTVGKYQSWLPDLLVLWNRQASCESACSARVGQLRKRMNTARTGDHSERAELIIVNAPPGLEISETQPLSPMAVGELIKNLCKA